MELIKEAMNNTMKGNSIRIQNDPASNNQKAFTTRAKKSGDHNAFGSENPRPVGVTIHTNENCSVIITTTTTTAKIQENGPQGPLPSTESSGDSDDDEANKPLRGSLSKKIKYQHNSDQSLNLKCEDYLQRNSSVTSCDSGSITHENVIVIDNSGSAEQVGCLGQLQAQETNTINPLLQQAEKIAGSFEGTCSKTWSQDSLVPSFEFTCKVGHTFNATIQEAKEKWCYRCDKKMKKLQRYASNLGGLVLNQYYDHEVRFQCRNYHIWTISYKNAKRRWCIQCRKDEQTMIKQQLEQEQRNREMQSLEEQSKLFEAAKKQLPSTANSGAKAGVNAANNNSRLSTAERFQQLEKEICALAMKKTAEYLNSKAYKGECTEEQVLSVYNALATPEEVLKSYMSSLSVEYLRSEFKRLAKSLHPDKNKHPRAGDAFQKVLKVYEWALERFAPTI